MKGQPPHALTVRIAPSSPEIFGWGRVPQARVKETSCLVLTYLDDGTPLTATPRWADGPRIVGRDVARSILATRLSRDRLALLLKSPRVFRRKVGQRHSLVTSAEA